MRCEREEETILSFKEFEDLDARPKCCETSMMVQLQSCSLQFKGTGWTPKFGHGNARGPDTDLLIPKKR
jgi:predicted nucleic acid-binding Zn ribbon protein